MSSDRNLDSKNLKYGDVFVEDLIIKNFKTIESLNLKTKKINIFIGEPNVGKSNILEALGICSAIGSGDSIRNYVRLRTFADLFYNHHLNRKISLSLKLFEKQSKTVVSLSFKDDTYSVFLNDKQKGILHDYHANELHDKKEYRDMYGNSGYSRSGQSYSEYYYFSETVELDKIKFYKFRNFNLINDNNLESNRSVERSKQFLGKPKSKSSLMTPNGSNLLEVIYFNEFHRKVVKELVEEFDYKLVLNRENQSIELQKEENGIVLSLPLETAADTLQSIIYYYMAIDSNRNNVLVFEEPESHTFPHYTKNIAAKIVSDTTNQFFIATHNPYFLNEILDKANQASYFVNLVYTKDHKTKVKQLTKDDVTLLKRGDPFFVLNKLEGD